jgi:hypothetical protein
MSFTRAPIPGCRVHSAYHNSRHYKLGHYPKAINLTHLYLGDKILIEFGYHDDLR